MPETHRHRRDSATASAAASAQPPPTPAKPNTRLLRVLLQALIMALVVILFAGFTAILFLHLCLLGGALRRPFRRRHNHHYLLDSDDSPPGLSSSQLDAIPRARFRAIPEPPLKPSEACAICLEDLVDGEWCRELPGCKHVFHRSCVDRWLAKAPGCPVCRTTVTPAVSLGNRQ